MLIDKITKDIFEKEENRIRFVLEIVRKDLINNISKIFAGEISVTKINLIIRKASSSFLKDFRKITWKERCKETIKSNKIFRFDSAR